MVPGGDTVLFALASANHDPDHIPHPERIDLNRQGAGHLGFGHGPHYCLGAPLARIETRIALWTAIHRLPDLTLAVPADQLPWKVDHRQHALAALPVTFNPQPTE